MKYAEAPGTASSTAETRPPADDSETPTVSLRAFSFSPTFLASGSSESIRSILLGEDVEHQGHRFADPYGTVAMVFEILAGIGMDEHGEVAMVQRQPGDQRRELVVLERHLIAEHRMRADRLFVEAAHLDVERLLDLLAQCPGPIARAAIEVDVGVPVLDLRRVHDCTLSHRSARLSEPSTVPRCGRAC